MTYLGSRSESGQVVQSSQGGGSVASPSQGQVTSALPQVLDAGC